MKRKNLPLFSGAATGLVLLLAPASHAVDGTYNSQTGAWNVTGSWSDSTIATGTDGTAYFTNDVTTSNRNTSLGADRIIGHIVFTDSDNSAGNGFNRTLTGTTFTLTLNVSTGTPSINVTQADRNFAIAPIVAGNDGLTKLGAGALILTNASNSYSEGTFVNAGSLQLNASGAAGSGTINLGAASGSVDAEVRLSTSGTNINNALTVNTGSSGIKTLANRSSNTVTYSGNITANDNLTVLSANDGGRLTVSGAANTIATGKTVTFSNTGTATNATADSALWAGLGSISYTSSSATGFNISGAKTYSGGASLGAMSGAGVVEVGTSSTGPANAPTDGAFGKGTLSIGATRMRAGTTGDITIGNAVTFTDHPTFTTVGSEKSLIFSGNASLGATRTLTVETGSTVAGKFVEFSGEISGSGFGIDKAGAGTLVLSGTNTYTGATTVSAGTLVIDGSTAAGSAVSVGASGTLRGTGTINGTLAVTGLLAPGTANGNIETLDAGATTWNGGSIWNFDLSSSDNTSDKLNITGDLVKGTGSGFVFNFMGSTPLWNATYTLAQWSGSLSGFNLDASEFDAVASRATLGSGAYSTSYFSITENTLTFTAVPEPTSALAGPLLTAGLLRRRRKC